MVPAASHGTLNTHNELTGVHIDLEPLRFDSTYIHVNPGDIFKPVTNYSLPPRPTAPRTTGASRPLIGGLCSHLSLTTSAGQPVVQFIYRVTGETRGVKLCGEKSGPPYEPPPVPGRVFVSRICCEI